MTDLPPLDPCPADERGRHRMEGTGMVSDEQQASSLTWICVRCGVVRQVAGFGPLYAERLDDLTTTQLDAVFPWDRNTETR